MVLWKKHLMLFSIDLVFNFEALVDTQGLLLTSKYLKIMYGTHKEKYTHD